MTFGSAREHDAVSATSVVRRPTCATTGCACHDDRRRWNSPNAVTLVRTVVSVVLVVASAAAASWALLVAAYSVYWIGDIADGAVARRTGQETRLGAALDVLCDRINTTTCALALLMFVPATVPVTVFLVQFVLVDLALTLLTLRWPVLSPNYSGLVDTWVFRANWHPLAKATNTGLLVLLVVLVPDQRWAVGAASAVLTVKVVSLIRVVWLLRRTRPGARESFEHIAPGSGPVPPATTGTR